jgi:hypothetical protein
MKCSTQSASLQVKYSHHHHKRSVQDSRDRHHQVEQRTAGQGNFITSSSSNILTEPEKENGLLTGILVSFLVSSQSIE